MKGSSHRSFGSLQYLPIPKTPKLPSQRIPDGGKLWDWGTTSCGCQTITVSTLTRTHDDLVEGELEVQACCSKHLELSRPMFAKLLKQLNRREPFKLPSKVDDGPSFLTWMKKRLFGR